EKNQMAAVISPETAAMLKKIYSQTLSRTYVNSQGERIMLSIAYGGDQSDTMQVHYPEVCYPAQGFQLLHERSETLKLANSSIPVKRLETSLTNQRFEPITYWTTVGDQVVQGGLNKKIAEMRYGIRGQIPDGLLFRVSSIDMNTEHAYRLHDSFVNALEKTLAPENRKRLMGSAS
ncbi:MAG: EpsI family protein, partial [Janthinobacterium sp.]